jgi:hypothetical protein
MTHKKTIDIIRLFHIALRSGKEHHSLRVSQFALVDATTKEPEKLIYTFWGEK